MRVFILFIAMLSIEFQVNLSCSLAAETKGNFPPNAPILDLPKFYQCYDFVGRLPSLRYGEVYRAMAPNPATKDCVQFAESMPELVIKMYPRGESFSETDRIQFNHECKVMTHLGRGLCDEKNKRIIMGRYTETLGEFFLSNRSLSLKDVQDLLLCLIQELRDLVSFDYSHNNLNPFNIMFRQEGNFKSCRLIDFSNSRPFDERPIYSGMFPFFPFPYDHARILKNAPLLREKYHQSLYHGFFNDLHGLGLIIKLSFLKSISNARDFSTFFRDFLINVGDVNFLKGGKTFAEIELEQSRKYNLDQSYVLYSGYSERFEKYLADTVQEKFREYPDMLNFSNVILRFPYLGPFGMMGPCLSLETLNQTFSNTTTLFHYVRSQPVILEHEKDLLVSRFMVD